VALVALALLTTATQLVVVLVLVLVVAVEHIVVMELLEALINTVMV